MASWNPFARAGHVAAFGRLLGKSLTARPRPDEAELLKLIAEGDDQVEPAESMGTRLAESWEFAERAYAAVTQADRDLLLENANIAASLARTRRQILLRYEANPTEYAQRAQLGARAAELIAIAFAAAENYDYGYDELHAGVQLEQYALELVAAGPQQRAAVAHQQARRLVALAWPKLVDEDGEHLYDPPLHAAAPAIATAATSACAQVMVAMYLLGDTEWLGPSLAQLPLAGIPGYTPPGDARRSTMSPGKAGMELAGSLGLRAALAVTQDPQAGRFAWSQARALINGMNFVEESTGTLRYRAGAAQAAEPAAALRILLIIGDVARASGRDEGAFLCGEAGDVLQSIFPQARSTQVLISGQVDEDFGEGSTLRDQLARELDTFLGRMEVDTAALGISSGEVAHLRAALAAMSSDERLELGAHAAIANRFAWKRHKARESATGASLMAAEFPVMEQEAIGYALVDEAKRTSQCFTVCARTFGLDTASEKTLQTVAVGRFKQAGTAFSNAGNDAAARDAGRFASDLSHSWGI